MSALIGVRLVDKPSLLVEFKHLCLSLAPCTHLLLGLGLGRARRRDMERFGLLVRLLDNIHDSFKISLEFFWVHLFVSLNCAQICDVGVILDD